ncbi:MAG: hypothetical protein U0Y82_07605 [Thermoleophilia bacterium]|mgnify:CR=1 FL=1
MGLQEEIEKLVNTESAKHKRLVEYVTDQLREGRHLGEVLGDPYVTNRLSPLEQRALLEEPEIIAVSHDEVLGEMRAKLEAAVGH